MLRRHRIEAEELQHRLSEDMELTWGKSVRSFQFSRLFSVITNFERLAGLIYRYRSKIHNDPSLTRMEDVVGQISNECIQAIKETNEDRGLSFQQKYHHIWKANISLFHMTLLLFFTTLLIGWYIAVHYPQYVLTILDQGILERVLNQERWFDELNKSPLLGASYIAYNNISVSIKCFAGGALLGLGGILLLFYNGLVIGCLVGYCYMNNFDEPLVKFMIAHGPLELSIVVAAVFASLLYGRVFYMRPYKGFSKRFSIAARQAGIVLLGILPWLIFAGFIEGFVSPSPHFSPMFKFLVGVLSATLFWVWTFWPRSARRPD